MSCKWGMVGNWKPVCDRVLLEVFCKMNSIIEKETGNACFLIQPKRQRGKNPAVFICNYYQLLWYCWRTTTSSGIIIMDFYTHGLCLEIPI